MKNLFRFSLVILSVFMANVAKADDMELLVKVAKENNKWVSFITNESQNIDLTLYSSTDEVLYEQRLKTVGNKFKTYDLSALPLGLYTLKMESPLKTVTYQIEITADSAIVATPVVKIFKKPSLAKEKDLVTLNLNGVGEGEVQVDVYNEFNEKLHEDVYTSEAKVVRKYDVSRTPSKQLTFVVRTGNQEFSETIKL
ncbi:hypothetical protein [Pedobacter sp.]|uniref:hypothetical protein n=1 Tax=Pedobacter sp. TaxID=1411316 RepID=UPI0031DFDB3F